MTLADILKVKGSQVHTIHPDETVEAAVQELVRHNVGALVVCERDLEHGEKLCGIITERDILRFVAHKDRSAADTKVAEVMTRSPHTRDPSCSVEEAMAVMTQLKIRHLPVVSGGKLVGIVSIGDLVKAELDRLEMENKFMRRYIQT
ncbi:MAG: CBS domain-containing protein [Thermoguttaceae bacterium]|nr:CBS domain-containing protein [Thermoguttaceae bacterium]MDW8078597.1 CBS domain-containing protein [Thermoguttaceae bacterium]